MIKSHNFELSVKQKIMAGEKKILYLFICKVNQSKHFMKHGAKTSFAMIAFP